MAYFNNHEDKEQHPIALALSAFQNYATDRGAANKADYTGAFGSLGRLDLLSTAFSKVQKVGVANKIVSALESISPLSLTDDEIAIVSHGTLGRIYNIHKDIIELFLQFSSDLDSSGLDDESKAILTDVFRALLTEPELYPYKKDTVRERYYHFTLSNNKLSIFSTLSKFGIPYTQGENADFYEHCFNYTQYSEKKLNQLKLLAYLKFSGFDDTKKFLARYSEFESFNEGFMTLESANIYNDDTGHRFYNALINCDFFDLSKLIARFKTLHLAQIPFEEGAQLWTVILDSAQAEKLAAIFAKMHKENIPINSLGMILYNAVINANYQNEELANLFIAMHQSQISINQTTIKLYKAVIETKDRKKELADALIALSQSGIYIDETSISLYEAISKTDNLKELANLFIAMYQSQIPINQTTIKLYKAVVETKDRKKELADALIALSQSGISIDETSIFLYEAISNTKRKKTELAKSIIMLDKSGISYDATGIKIYKILINSGDQFTCLAGTFIKLLEEGIPINDISAFYDSFFEDYLSYDELKNAFLELHKNGLPYNEATAELYNSIFKEKKCSMLEIASAFVLLHKANIAYEGDNKTIYHQVANKNKLAKETAEKISILMKSEHIPNEEMRHKICIEVLKIESFRLKNVLAAFELLQKTGFSYSDNELKCYQMIVDNNYYATNLAQSFIKLKREFKITCEGDGFNIFTAVCDIVTGGYQNARLDKNMTVYQKLQSEGILYEDNEALYQCEGLIKISKNSISQFTALLELLKEIGIEYSVYPAYFNANVLSLFRNLSFTLLTELKKLGFSLPSHNFIYCSALEQVTKGSSGSSIAIKLVEQLKKQVSLNPKLLEKTEMLQVIVESSMSNSDPDIFQQGPLNKKKSTYLVEALLQYIADNHESVEVFFNSLGEYVFRVKNHTQCDLPLLLQEEHENYDEINLSLLLRNANLSHLTLDNSLINKIGTVLQSLLGKTWNETKCEGDYSLRLDEDNSEEKQQEQNAAITVRRKAIGVYCEGYSITNINALFLSKKASSQVLLVADDPKKSALASFLLGCLVSDTAATLYQERKESGKEKLVRYLTLTPRQTDMLTANPYSTFPANTSFSFKNDGCEKYDRGRNGVSIEVPNPPHYNQKAIKTFLSEAILPAGESGIVKKMSNNSFLWSIVRSPSLDPGDHYWSEQALNYAFTHHLKHEYKHTKEEFIVKDNVIIQRPNHNMPHTYRVMLSIELVVNYFASHAADQGFRRFCQDITPEEIEWLRVAAAFSVTGRESEIDFSQSPKQYAKYKEASADNFRAFTQKMAPITGKHKQAEMVDRCCDAIQHRGDPNYDAMIEHLDPKECNKRHYYMNILKLAHDIDLMRCFSPNKFIHAMNTSYKLSKHNVNITNTKHTDSAAQRHAFMALLQHNAQQIEAHGDKLSVAIDANGEFTQTRILYRDRFLEASHSPKGLREMSQTVTKPDRLEYAEDMNSTEQSSFSSVT